MTKAVAYLRVSGPGQTCENQVPVLEAWAKQRGFDLVRIYQEQESAWRAGHQRELARLIQDARKGQFSIVLVWALDRMSRLGALSILSLIHRLSGYGVRVLSYTEPWTEAPGELAEVLFAIAGWVARMESQRRSERTKVGLARVRAAGVRLGRPQGAKDKKRRKKRSVRNGLFLNTDFGEEF